MTERRSFEQIDLTGQIPMWRMIDDRNREICSAAPLVYYNVVRPPSARMESGESAHSRGESASSLGPVAMGSIHETPEVAPATDVPPAAAAAEREEENTTVQSEAVPTSVAEEVELDKDVEDALLQELKLNLKNLELELDTRLGESLEKLKDLVPEKKGKDEGHPEFEIRVKSWLEDMEKNHPSLIDSAQILAEGLIDGSGRKDGYLESFALAKEKRKQLAKTEKDPSKKEFLLFDISKYLMESTKDQRIFYEKVQKLLEDLKTAIEEPMTLDPKILPELGNLVKDLSKMMDGNAGMQHHYLGTIQSLVKQVESLNWEMSGKRVDRRAIPAWDKSSTSKIMKESAREVMAGIRWSLQEMGHMLREQGLVQDKQLTVLSDLAASAQRTAEVLEMINEREAKHQDAMEKKKADKAVEEQKKMDAARLRAQKEQAEKDRIAQEDEVQKLAGESARKRKMEELESANKALEEAQKKAKALESELNQGTPVKNMPARPRMIQTPTVPVPEPLYPPTPAVPEPVYPPGYLPPQMQMVPPAGWAPMTPGSQMGYGMPTGPMMAPPGPVMSPTAPMAAPMAPPPAPGAP